MASNIEESRGSIDTDSKDLEKAPETTTVDHVEEGVFPGWRKVAIIMIAVYLAMFLVALDRTILGTAIPKITDDFNSIDDVVVILLFILHTPPSTNKDTIKQQIMKLDPFGTVVFLPGIVCLLLALQWGGTTYAWSNARIIVLFILAGILLSIFVVIQFRSGDNATVPIRIIKQRSIASGVYFSIVSPGSMFVIIYFLPLWFQAIKGVSAIQSGIDTIPMVMALVLASIIARALTSKTGYYVPQLLACAIIASIGAVLLTTLKVDTPSSKWIGFQILYGFGLGLGMQQAGMAAQTCLDKKDVMTGVSLMFFMQGLGGSIFISIAQQIFTHSMVQNLQGLGGLDPAMILGSGATELRHLVPPQFLDVVLVAYNKALSDTLKVAVACAAATIVAGCTMEWKNLKGMRQGGPTEEKKAKEEIAEEVAVDAELKATGKGRESVS